ncbi:MAG: AAA family ATPase [Desulfobacteraceae bacterium]|nr:AAA family ATPase [Desulfobacteraceae bacterium]MBC2748757.1 AAA family ATPase [Desulfobacteraceae bacterium]
MNAPVFYELEKRFGRNLRYTARFYPVDLHCHSPLSPCFGRKDGDNQYDIEATAEQIAIAGCRQGLHLLAITDHHRCEMAYDINDACQEIKKSGQNHYPNNNLIVLPGMEISVEENAKNIHLLAIFPNIYNFAEIERILDDTGVESNSKNRNDQSKVTTKRLIEMVRRVQDRGGLAILAHVNSTNGYREEMKSLGWDNDKILENIFSLNVNAVEISKPDDAPHFAMGENQLPCVIGSDAHYLKDIGGKEFITRVKMTEPGFDGLKRALKDPQTRIRFKDQQSTGIKTILGIKFDGGFLDQQIISFTSNLNCLIGGRGTGKSSCIEAIRYLFDKQIPTERSREIKKLRENVLSGCTAHIIFKDQHGENFVLQRTFGDPATKILTIDGHENTEIDLQMSQNLKLSFYGWSEIEGIAKESSQQLDLIDGFIEGINQLKRDEQAAIGDLKANARDIKSAMDEVKREADNVGNLRELKADLGKIGEEQKEEEQKKEMIDNEVELLDDLKTNLESIYDEINNIDLKGEIKDLSELIIAAIDDKKILFTDDFYKISEVLLDSIKENSLLITAKQNLLSELTNIQNHVSEQKTALKTKQGPIEAAFIRLLEEIDKPEVKQIAQERERLRNQIRLKERAKRKKEEAEKVLKEHEDARKDLIKKLKDVRSDQYNLRNSYVSAISDRLPKGKAKVEVTIEVEKQGEREQFRNLLKQHFTGLPRNWHAKGYVEKISNHYTPIEFVTAIKTRNFASFVSAGFDIDEGKDIISHLIDKSEDIMELEICRCTDLPRIYFDVQGTKKPIEDLSPGQRCTALLPIILLETDTPLIIDQPEDNLDNQFIFNLVVTTMRSLKECRQIIVATHNPNIPVSGDAENILVFKPDGKKGKLERNGSIDYSPIIEDVKTIMEGGEDAFKVRASKYRIQY